MKEPIFPPLCVICGDEAVDQVESPSGFVGACRKHGREAAIYAIALAGLDEGRNADFAPRARELCEGRCPYPLMSPERTAWMQGLEQGLEMRWRPADARLAAGELLPCHRCGEPSVRVIPTLMGGLPTCSACYIAWENLLESLNPPGPLRRFLRRLWRRS